MLSGAVSASADPNRSSVVRNQAGDADYSTVGLAYTVFIGLPLCVALVTAGLLLCATILGIPVGIAFMAIGFKYVTLPGRHFL